jgi:hypothetical protein
MYPTHQRIVLDVKTQREALHLTVGMLKAARECNSYTIETELDSEEWELLMIQLHGNPNIKRLLIKNITVVGSNFLAKFLANNKTLITLELVNTYWGYNSIWELVYALKKNTSVTELNLMDNRFSYYETKRIDYSRGDDGYWHPRDEFSTESSGEYSSDEYSKVIFAIEMAVLKNKSPQLAIDKADEELECLNDKRKKLMHKLEALQTKIDDVSQEIDSAKERKEELRKTLAKNDSAEDDKTPSCKSRFF